MNTKLKKLEKIRQLLGGVARGNLKPRQNSRVDRLARELGIIPKAKKSKRKTKKVMGVSKKRVFK